MKIAMIGQKGIPALHGGIERHVHELSLRLVKAGFAVRVYGRKWYTKSENTVLDGIELINTPTLHTKHLDTIVSTLFSTIHAIWHKVDVIHYHGVGPALLSFIPRIFSPKTLVLVTFHSIDRKHQKWGIFARFSLLLGEWAASHFPHKTIAVSRTIFQYVRDVYDTESVYIPNAVPLYEPLQDTSALKQWNLETKEYFLLVSRLIPHKGIHYIVDAWKKLLETSPELIGKKKLVIVGDGYYTDEYVAFVKERAKNISSIVFTGFQSGSDLNTLYSHAHMMLHASDNEGLPIAVLEGMSYGLPVLLSDIVEHKDLVDNPQFLFARANVEALTLALQNLLKMDARILKDEGQRNRTLIEKEFDWDQVMERLISVYTTSSPRESLKSIPAENI